MVKFKVTDNPRGNLWTQDESRFGFQMLSKMGWKHGKGIGKNEDGMAEPIKVRLKEDVKGVGYHQKNDQWMDNQEEFSQLLARLNSNCSSNKIDSNQASTNLETKSKTSRCRIHYSKFVKGKDVQQYSQKDLSAIIGKRKKDTSNNDEKSKMEEKFTTSTYSIEEYFAKKLGNKNNSKECVNKESTEKVDAAPYENEDNCSDAEKPRKRRLHDEITEDGSEDLKKKRKKRRKC